MSSISQSGVIGGIVQPRGNISGSIGAKGSLNGEINNSQRDYRTLKNKPSINGTELIDNYDEIDPTVPEWAKNSEKPTYTYQEVGAVGGENQTSFEDIDRMFSAIFGI